ncbi:MAG: hypothetical protein IPN68_05800 [Bacteroidetes bacterium]|nr:hypothetical protein [Bacteroidota bacterium]
MKTIRFFLIVTFIIPFLSCNAQSSEKAIKPAASSSDKIEAYYFHFTARCTTCKTIEAQAKEDLEILYPNQVKQGLITFQSLNLEEAPNKTLADKLGVSGQALLLVKGDQKINLTNEGFLYAVAKPDRFKQIINEKVDGLLMIK